MRRLNTLAMVSAILSMGFASPSWSVGVADSSGGGSGQLTKSISTTGKTNPSQKCEVRAGITCFFRAQGNGGSADVGNSAVFSVPSGGASICYMPDDDSLGLSSFDMQVWRQVIPNNYGTSGDPVRPIGAFKPEASSGSLLEKPSNGVSDCFNAVAGDYWLEVIDGGADASHQPVVAITGLGS